MMFVSEYGQYKVFPVFVPTVVVMGSPGLNQTLKEQYIRVIYHYYNQWYDYSSDLISGKIVYFNYDKCVVKQQSCSELIRKRQAFHYKNMIVDKFEVPLYDFNWMLSGNILDLNAETRVFPSITIYNCTLDKYTYSGNVTNIFSPCWKIGASPVTEKEMTHSKNMDTMKYLRSNDPMTPILLQSKKGTTLTSAQQSIANDNEWEQETSHLNVIIHTHRMNKARLDTAVDFCKCSSADFAEVFKDKIYIHTRGVSPGFLHQHRYWYKNPQWHQDLPPRKTYIAEVVKGSPELKLTRFKRK